MTSPFPQSSYYQKTLSGITLSKTTIKDCEFEECNFTKLNLSECRIEKCKFINCKFEDCIFSTVKPTDSSFLEIEFKDCKVQGFDWTLALRINSLAFTNCQINYSNFRFLKLQKTKLINSVAKEADFTECNLSESDFSGTDFEGSIFFKTNLTKVNFIRASNYFIDIRTNTLKKAKFSFPQVIGLLRSLDITIE